MSRNTPHEACWATVSQAARIAGVSRRTIFEWIRGGKVELVRTPGGHARINPRSLFCYTASGPVKPGPKHSAVRRW